MSIRAMCRDLRATHQGLRANQRDLQATQQGLRARQRWGMFIQMGVWMDIRKFSPFYKTLSPFRAATQKGGQPPSKSGQTDRRMDGHTLLESRSSQLKRRWT